MMVPQRPDNPDGLSCPLWRKPTVKVCRTCTWWVPVAGTHPQTGEPINQHMCAITAQFLASVTVAKHTNETTATVQEMRNEAMAERVAQTRMLALRPISNIPHAILPQAPAGLIGDRRGEAE